MNRHIHTFFSILAIGIIAFPATSRAAVVEYANACPGSGIGCVMSIGDTISIVASTFDAAGDLVVSELGTPGISYQWRSIEGGVLFGPTGTSALATTFDATTQNGNSLVYVTFPAGASPVNGELRGVVEVTVVNGTRTSTQRYGINARCDSEPRLYSAIASVRLTTDQGWQSANADVLETCRIEYQLKNNTGWTSQN